MRDPVYLVGGFFLLSCPTFYFIFLDLRVETVDSFCGAYTCAPASAYRTSNVVAEGVAGLDSEGLPLGGYLLVISSLLL